MKDLEKENMRVDLIQLLLLEAGRLMEDTSAELALTLPAAPDTHLYEFRFAGDTAFGIPDPDYHSDISDARKTALRAALDDCGGKSFHYIYDFGDYWDHVVTVERIEAGVSDFPYPSLLATTGRCPPEDVGGPSGYDEYLEALADPDHPEHKKMLEWEPADYDPDNINIADIAIHLMDLGMAWQRKPRRKADATAKS